jgi:signal transduction histidine kinase
MYELELSCIDADEGQTENLGKDLNKVQGSLGAEIDSLRMMMIDLRPPLLDERGLVGAIQAHIDLWSGKLPIVNVSTGLPHRLDQKMETVLFRVAQEALINVAKHASATKVSVELTEKDGAVTLAISDDGIGFISATTPSGHIGLDAMRERVESVGGSLTVDSAPGAGTSIAVRFEQEEMVAA